MEKYAKKSAASVYCGGGTHPNNIAHVPTVNIPPLNKSFGPSRLSCNASLITF
jgi:hypothetical protein